ncbi:MAG TPA: multidrug ABC transporter ATP-binding protein [Muricauda sp.]|uniref:ABC transporter permease n=1 Tax=Flagellimonas aurea TaxID=2915619 RepID=A0ABS3G8Y0_9FLAO|nr:ABC transporter permease [Allomuricauda aurea]MAO18641.1 multidrug ABC transporter ATP-binding protein [Allomuricauda sp.]UBZ12609.1 ABC transporter permease [Allomuricauda aquimarina]MBC72768.1 multidrug ABC transporter ATP-binding protein [Allomuricauda sp.]MBO0355047.1 ABC transporter permease [Allomuricauda aurea]HBU77282.1 multidrug ABC transporter ATP-binding protein [Allomuricauda sp.]
MFNKDRWREIIEVLTTNVWRTIFTAFGVCWGIFILIVLLAAGKGLENGIKQDFGDTATNTMFMWTRATTRSYEGLPKGRSFEFKIDDVQALRDNVPNLRFISPRNQLGGFGGNNNVVYGLRTGAYNVYGDYPEIINQDPMAVTSGRFLNYNDIREKRKVAIIGNGVKNDLYDKDEEALGTYIKIQGVNFMVIGTYKKNNSGGGEEGQKEIFVPFTSFSQAFNRGENVGWMAITANDGSSISQLKDKIVDVMKKRHKVHPEDTRAVGYFDLFEQYNRVESLFGALKAVAYIVGIMVLLSGIIGVSNIMLIVVKERTKEIGIRRALGEQPWSIKKQILMESIFLTLISGMVGIIFGSLVIFGINSLLDSVGPVDMFMSPSVSVGVVTGALTILMVSGLLAGFIPAQSAIRVRPIEALRNE